jgi:hypothetical protein
MVINTPITAEITPSKTQDTTGLVGLEIPTIAGIVFKIPKGDPPAVMPSEIPFIMVSVVESAITAKGDNTARKAISDINMFFKYFCIPFYIVYNIIKQKRRDYIYFL